MRKEELEFRKKDKRIRVLFYVLGIIIVALGVRMTVAADRGTGSWDAVSVGLYRTFNPLVGGTLGFWVNAMSLGLIVVSGVLVKKMPRVTTLITSFFVGVSIDFWGILFQRIPLERHLGGYGCMLLGIIIVAVGAGFNLSSGYPATPTDYLMVCIRERFKFSITLSKMISEGTGIILALILGGSIGVGTVIAMLMAGAIIQGVVHMNQKLIYKGNAVV